MDLGALLSGLAAGANQGAQNFVGMQQQAYERQIKEQERLRQQKIDNLSMLDKIISLRKEGMAIDPLTAMYKDFSGQDVPTVTQMVPRKVETGRVEASRPTPGFMGPMPSVKGFATVQEPKQVSLLEQIRQKPDLKEVSAGSTLYDATNGKGVYTAPTNPSHQKLVTNSQGIRVPDAPGVSVPTGGRSGSGSKPRMGWITQPDGSKVWGELSTGVVSNKPKKQSTLSNSQLLNEAKASLRLNKGLREPDSFSSDGERATYDDLIRKEAKRIQSTQGQGGQKSLAQELKELGI